MLVSDHLLSVDIPGPVSAWKRAGTNHGQGKFYTRPEARSAQRSLGWWLRQAWRGEPLNEPLTLRVTVSVPVPKGHSKKFRADALAGQVVPAAKPDLDNVIKQIGDAGNKVVWADDARIAELHVRRRYAEAPGLSITVERCAGA